ncbi:MAG: Ig-like domain-containing protein [Anaerolineales bacterium]
MKIFRSFLVFFILAIIPFSVTALGKKPQFSTNFRPVSGTLELKLTRDWGYGGFKGHIQGTFSLRASGPDTLVEVRFIIDDEGVNVDTEPPYRYQFRTDEYPPGDHTLTAIGTLADGSQIRAREIKRHFLSDEEARQETMKFVVPLLVGVGGLTLLGIIGPLLLGRKREHRPGQYGIAGGAVCPRCTLPFSRHVLSPNLLAKKLERCPHCRKWSAVPRAAPAALETAEARLAQENIRGELPPESEEERLRKLIEESRFDD